MPTDKIELNTVYISERVRESLRLASRCALTAVTAPMGYGKTTAVNWFLAGRIKSEHAVVVRINIYSDNLSLFWKSVRKAFAAEGMDFIKEYSLPTDSIGSGMLTDELCRSLAGETPCYIFLDDFHLLGNERVDAFICNLANVLPQNVHIIIASRHIFPKDSETVRLGSKLHIIGKDTLRLNHTELSVYTERCGIELTDADTDALLDISEGWFSAIYFALRAYAQSGRLPDGNCDIYEMFTTVLIDPLTEEKSEFIAVMGLADEFTSEMAEAVTGAYDVKDILSGLIKQNSFVTRLSDGLTYRFHHIMKECASRSFNKLSDKKREMYLNRYGEWYERQKDHYRAIKMFQDSGNKQSMLKVIAVDRAEQLSYFPVETIVRYISECSDSDLSKEPYAILVIMRRYFSWRMMPEMLHLRDLLTETVNGNSAMSDEERNNILGECDLVMSFTAYNDICRMSEYHRSACEKMTCTSQTMGKMGTWTFGSPSVLALFHRKNGELDNELSVMRESMPYYYKLTEGHSKGAEFVMQAEAEYLRGNMTNAAIEVEKAVHSASENEQEFILACCSFLKMRISFFGKTGAEPFSKNIKRFINPVLMTVNDVCEGYYYALTSQREKIAEWLIKDSGADILFPAKPIVEIVINRILLMNGEYTKLIARYSALLEMSSVYPYELCKLYLSLQTASAYHELGQDDKAIEYLDRAIDSAKPDGIIIPFAEYYDGLNELLPDELADKILPFAHSFKRNISEQKNSVLYSSALDELSGREKEIALLISQGYRNKDIAEKLFLTEGSVKQYINRIYSKLTLKGTAAEKRKRLISILKC